MRGSLKRLFRLLSPRQRWRGALLVVLLLGNALLEMAGLGLVPVYIGILADPDRLLHNAHVLEVMRWAGFGPEHVTQATLLYGGSALLFAVFLLKLLYVPFSAYVRARYVQGVVKGLSVQLFGGYMRAPYEFHLARHSSELMRNITAESMRLGEQVLSPLIGTVSYVLITGAIVALLLVSIPGTALLALLAFGLIVTPLVSWLNVRLERLSRAAQDGRKRTIRAVQEGVGGVKELRLLGREAYFVERFRAALTKVLDLQRFLQVQHNALPVFIEWVAVTALLLVTLLLFRAGESTESLLGMVALFALAMARLKSTVTGGLNHYAQVGASLVSVDVVDHDLRELAKLRARPQPVEPGAAREPIQLTDSLQLHDLWFRYAGSEDDVLRGIDLSIRAGEAVGFVGPSGGGKSTLVDVVLGILEPQRGRVEVDGRDIRQNLRGWHRNVGYIPQSIYLIDGTIRQNIALGLEDREIDAAAVARAVSAASLNEFVSSLPDGIETVIGERGVRLSGGQRQRIAIARALYNDPSVLIMDEATSALDNLTEKAVMEAVDALKGNRTILMIAHRLSTVRNCDQIVFLRAGEVVGMGTYAELAESHSEFRRMAASG